MRLYGFIQKYNYTTKYTQVQVHQSNKYTRSETRSTPKYKYTRSKNLNTLKTKVHLSENLSKITYKPKYNYKKKSKCPKHKY
jgi:hypothetical protein